MNRVNTIVCMLLLSSSYDLVDCSCPLGWLFNLSLLSCVHPITGDPPSNTEYCDNLYSGATVETLNGIQMCATDDGSPGDALGSGGLLNFPGKRR